MSVAAGETPSPGAVPLYAGYLFDLDGTIYLGDELLPGARELVHRLRELGRETLFLSNNPTRDPQMYADKLDRLGIPTPVERIVNPVVTMAAWLRAEAPDASVFVIGEEPLVRAIENAGIRVTNRASEVDIVVASYDRTLDYAKLQVAFDALWQYGRARLVATNPDAYCPLPGGAGQPDTAAVVAALEASTGRRCELNVGKPAAVMLETATRILGLAPADCLMVGDRLYTDIAMAVDAGIDSALVLTGESTPEMVAALPQRRRPTWVLHGVPELLAPVAG